MISQVVNLIFFKTAIFPGRIYIYEQVPEGDHPGSGCCPTMLGILISVSSSACGRVFSLAWKNRTEIRSALGSDAVEALMILKPRGEMCYKAEPSDSLLLVCEQAPHTSLLSK